MKARLTLDVTGDPSCAVAVVECLDPGIVGYDAVLTVSVVATVRDSRPVHGQREVARHEFRLVDGRQEIRLPHAGHLPHTYRGLHLDCDVKAELRIDDGIVCDTKIKAAATVDPPNRPAAAACAKAVVEPMDRYSFWPNWRAIPAGNKLNSLILATAVLVAGAVNTAVGVRDQFALEGKTYFYRHRDHDGDARSPIVESGGVTAAMVLALWLAVRLQLRTYMTFKRRGRLGRLGRDTRAVVGDLFHGRARVPLDDVLLRLVACNMERGQYTRGSGSNERTVSFTEPVRGVVLFEKRVARIPAHTPVESFFPEIVSFARSSPPAPRRSR